MSLALAGPISRGSRWVPPAPGMRPSRISGWPTLALWPSDPEVGAQRQLKAAAERVPGDRGDHRLADPGHGGEGVLQPPRAGRRHLGVARPGHLLDVRARPRRPSRRRRARPRGPTGRRRPALAAAAISSCTAAFSAFIGGRSSRIVATAWSTSTCTSSPTAAPPVPSHDPSSPDGRALREWSTAAADLAAARPSPGWPDSRRCRPSRSAPAVRGGRSAGSRATSRDSSCPDCPPLSRCTSRAGRPGEAPGRTRPSGRRPVGSARTVLAAWANALAAGSSRAARAALETRLRLRPALVASDRRNAASASRQAWSSVVRVCCPRRRRARGLAFPLPGKASLPFAAPSSVPANGALTLVATLLRRIAKGQEVRAKFFCLRQMTIRRHGLL